MDKGQEPQGTSGEGAGAAMGIAMNQAGEALMYSGNSDEAQRQFAAAGRLDLSESDKRELQQRAGYHG